MMTMRRAVPTGVCLVGICSGFAACGGQPAVCDDLDALRSSVSSLEDVKVGDNALSTLAADLQNIQSDLKQLSQDAGEEYSTEIDAVQKQTTSLRAGVGAAAADPTSAALSQVRTDLQGVGAAVSDLGDAMAGTCE